MTTKQYCLVIFIELFTTVAAKNIILLRQKKMGYILQAFPILYLNLGGELLYIIEQRLQAQEISAEKSVKGD